MTLGPVKRLSEQQRHFAKCIVKGMTQKDAAEEAGYRNASVSACQLLDNPLIQEYLEQLRAPGESAFIASREDCEKKLTEQINDPLLSPRDAREAIHLLGKMRGWHITKTEVSGSVTLAQPEMSDAEVKRRLAELAGK